MTMSWLIIKIHLLSSEPLMLHTNKDLYHVLVFSVHEYSMGQLASFK